MVELLRCFTALALELALVLAVLRPPVEVAGEDAGVADATFCPEELLLRAMARISWFTWLLDSISLV